ncbi:MAG: outer membrane protein OmpK [Gammaproteobacteria bacterium]|uniref:nucleoside-specific channel-forming Tsx family protein n=1 Tax=Shewanella baltica TaxID=62322 RepID=UPI001C732584|nr:outer membrane protein OmpK [Gammaproteobacteria bacterium]QYX63780.1 outer membrane protein OmpK [Shewanella putrefaciens]MBU1479775.1 outer membrane protein OmpK [Gammaproteobacteria bacterium]MBU2002782.1 outer membrane protein OmpK [Gammaproteobacteria bacterium]MBU2131185.1 outer membrane protein OmpK [Gammaproteobacteria bacterium]
MKNVKTLALAATAVAAISGNAFAADRTDLHGTDYKWMQFNAMYSIGEKPDNQATGDQHNYLEMEFGGRSGIFDLYGYVDVFNLANQTTEHGDKNPQEDPNLRTSKLFMKFAPRVSIDALTGKDLSFGPIQEVYFSTLFNWDGMNGNGVNSTFWGVGADVNVPWLGKTGMNLYGFYDMNAKEWNGYQFSANWFKPFYFFDNKSFLSFQGYIDYQFGADEDKTAFVPKTSNGGNIFFGLYWHSDRYALGYGLKGFKDVYLLEDGAGALALESTGWSHYLSATYKF